MEHVPGLRRRAVRMVLKGATLNETAGALDVHINTVWRWMRAYRTLGMESALTSAYGRSWNRAPGSLEERCVKLKEESPDLTLRSCRRILSEEGCRVSLKGIHNVWRRHNMHKRSLKDPLTPFGELTRETRNALVKAGEMLRKKDGNAGQKRAAGMLNALPSFPREKAWLLDRIEDRYLSPRRRLDKLYPKFMKMAMPEYARRARALRIMLERRGLRYSALIAGLNEAVALQWMRTPVEEIRLHKILRGYAGRMRDPVMNFQLSYLPATAYIEAGEMDKARILIRKSRCILRSLPCPSFLESFGDLMTFMGDYRSALAYHNRALVRRREKADRTRLMVKIALNHVIAGEYGDALRISVGIDIGPGNEYYMDYTAGRGFLCYGMGRFEKAFMYVRETLERAEKEQFRNTLYSAIIVLASAARALERFREAQGTLRKYLRLVEKYRLEREKALLEFFLEGRPPPGQYAGTPVFKLSTMLIKAQVSLKVKDFRRACAYAQRKGLMGFVHRYVVFFPEVVLNMLKRGYKTHLPNTILNFPVFNLESPVYNVRFMGPLVVYRNNQRLRIKLAPKEEALLIHLALKLGEPGKTMPVAELYRNFWPRSGNPAGRLSHMLVRIRNELRIPKHMLAISARAGERAMVNKGFYISTDHQDLEISLAEARALQRAEEWPYAREKYLQAFRFLRGEPFAKNYDNWSENMRTAIGNQLESAVSVVFKDLRMLKLRKTSGGMLLRLKKAYPGRDWSRTG